MSLLPCLFLVVYHLGVLAVVMFLCRFIVITCLLVSSGLGIVRNCGDEIVIIHVSYGDEIVIIHVSYGDEIVIIHVSVHENYLILLN